MMKQTILIAEGDRRLGRISKGGLTERFNVLTVSSGRCVLDLVRRARDIALVLLHYRLPDITGLEVLKEIKNLRPAVPVILLNSYGEESVAINAFRCGAKDYIRLPQDRDDIVGRIKHCIALANADRHNRRSTYYEASVRVPLQDVASRHHLSVVKALQFIDGNFTAKITLSAVADRACLSRHHFSRAFKTAMSVTYQEYLTSRRVDAAKEMLKGSRRTITEIAHAVGYSDSNNLIRNFKKRTGLTPSAFRSVHVQPTYSHTV